MRVSIRIAGVLTLVSAMASIATPVSAAPEPRQVGPAAVAPTHQAVTIRGSGARGAGFMDYTDDSCMDRSRPRSGREGGLEACDAAVVAQLQGLTPGGAYRLAASPDGCSATFQKATRIFTIPFTASARGTWWSGGTAVTFRNDGVPVAFRVLKGSSGTNQVGCGSAVDLTETLDDAAGFASIGRFGGDDRRGLVFALQDVEGSVAVTVALQDIPGGGSLRSRGVAGVCATPLQDATVVLRIPDLVVAARRTAFLARVVALEHGAKPADIDSFRLGKAAAPFTPTRCRNTLLLGVLED